MPENFQYAYAVIADILREKLGYVIVEPKTKVTEVTKAIPTISPTIEVEAHYMDLLKTPGMLYEMKKKMIGTHELTHSVIVPSLFNPKEKYSNRRVLETDKFKKLSTGLKLAVSMVDYKDRFAAEQVGFCLDDIIETIEEGRDKVERKAIENPLLKDKKVEEESAEAGKKLLGDKTKKTREYMKDFG